jgi:hypothetical protein
MGTEKENVSHILQIYPFDVGIKSLWATLPARILLLGILNFNAYS